eukprot:gene8252-76_t
MDQQIESKFITGVCEFLESKPDNKQYQIALKALKESSFFDENFQKMNLYEKFYTSQTTKSTIDHFLDFPLNLQFETIYSIFLNFKDNVKLEDRIYRLKTFKDCFIAKQAVDAIALILSVKNIFFSSNLREDSVLILQLFNKMGYIEHISEKERPISDALLFFKFKPISKDKNVAKQTFKQKFDAFTVVEKLDLTKTEFNSDYVCKVFLKFLSQIEVKNRKYKLKTYSNCWIAQEGVEWGVSNTGFSKEDMTTFLDFFRRIGLIEHVVDKSKSFQDDYLFFRFQSTVKENRKIVKLKVESEIELMNSMLKSMFPENLCILIGLSRSGKTTLSKLFNLHFLNETFSENELSHIFNSIYFDIKKLMEENKQLSFLKNKYETAFLNFSVDYYDDDLMDNFKILKKIWEEEEFQKAFEKRNESDYNFNDHLKYLFENIDRFLRHENNFDNYLRTYHKTSGIITNLVADNLKINDCVYQKNKWKIFYPSCNHAIFVISSVFYLKKDDHTFENAMMESIGQLKNMLDASEKFHFPVFIVLTKTDSFKSEFDLKKFGEYFPTFLQKFSTKENPSSPDVEALDYLQNFFKTFDERIQKVYALNLMIMDEFNVFVKDLENEMKISG